MATGEQTSTPDSGFDQGGDEVRTSHNDFVRLPWESPTDTVNPEVLAVYLTARQAAARELAHSGDNE